MPGGTQSAGPYELRLPIFLQPLGGALKNRSAAPASPPCFRRRRWSAPLLFESTLESETSVFYKTKSPAYFRTLSIFGGRGWITQAALLKTAHWAVFALSSATAPQLFESTRLCESDICAKENRQCISTPAVFSWARVDYASRAAKNSLAGCFCAVFGDSAAAVRIHPRK